jgi:hypothetical protein
MIYFLKNLSNNTVKIGRSKDPADRLRTLQTGNADKLEFLYIIDGVEDSFESFVHEICERYHISGEWFAGDVIEKHLLKHPWYAENMRPYAQWLKEQTDAIHNSNASASI